MAVMELYLKNLENDSMVCKMVGVKTLLGAKMCKTEDAVLCSISKKYEILSSS